MKVYDNLSQLENIIKELVRIVKQKSEENVIFKKELLKVKRTNETYEMGISKAVRMIEELLKELDEMKG